MNKKTGLGNIYYSPKTNKFYNMDVAEQKAKSKNKMWTNSIPNDLVKIDDEDLIKWQTRKPIEMVKADKEGKPQIVSAMVYSGSENKFYNLNGKHENLPNDLVGVSVERFETLSRLKPRETVLPNEKGEPEIFSTLLYSASTNSFYDLALGYKKLPDDKVHISEDVYLKCINKKTDELIIADANGYPVIKEMSKKDKDKFETEKETLKKLNEKYNIDIESISCIRSLIVENSNLFTSSETLEQLKKLQTEYDLL